MLLPEDYLIKQQGVPKEVVDKWRQEGFEHTAMICQDLFEQMEYEKALKAGIPEEDIRMYPLKHGGKAFWVRKSK